MTQLRTLMSSWGHDRLASPGEVALAGRVSGVLWLSGAVTLLLTLALPGSSIDALWAVAADRRVRGGLGRPDAVQALVGALAGAPVTRLHHPEPVRRGRAHARHRRHRRIGARLPVVRRRLRRVLLHPAPGRGLLAGLRRRPRAALPLRRAAPWTGTSRASSSSSCRCTSWSAAWSWPGASCWPAPPRARELEAQQRRMTEEQSSLRRVATAVAAGSPPAGIFALVSLDAGHLLGADCARHRPLPGRRPRHRPRPLDP